MCPHGLNIEYEMKTRREVITYEKKDSRGYHIRSYQDVVTITSREICLCPDWHQVPAEELQDANRCCQTLKL